MRVVSVAMESVSFSLMTEKTSIRRKVQLSIHTCRHLAAIWLQVGVQIFTSEKVSFQVRDHKKGQEETVLIGAFLRGRRVVARLLPSGKWAVVFSVTPSRQGIVGMVPG